MSADGELSLFLNKDGVFRNSDVVPARLNRNLTLSIPPGDYTTAAARTTLASHMGALDMLVNKTATITVEIAVDNWLAQRVLAISYPRECDPSVPALDFPQSDLIAWSGNASRPPSAYPSKLAACVDFNLELVLATLVPIFVKLREASHNIIIDDRGDWGAAGSAQLKKVDLHLNPRRSWISESNIAW